MGKTRGLFKKISDTKGTFLAKIGTIKDWNVIDQDIIPLVWGMVMWFSQEKNLPYTFALRFQARSPDPGAYTLFKKNI